MTVKPRQYPLAAQSAGSVPPRRPASLRRTTSIDVTWPAGLGGDMLMHGRGRDLQTNAAGEARILDEADFHLTLSANRTILGAHSPTFAGLEHLIGTRAGGASRKMIGELFAESSGQLIFQLLDDFAGSSLVAGWAWSNWMEDSIAATLAMAAASAGDSKHPLSRDMANICVGFAEGSSSLGPDGGVNQQGQSRAQAGALTRADDPQAWHDLPSAEGTAFRRARWIDVWTDAGRLAFEGGFQDSSTTPQGPRAAVHEYRLCGKLDHDGRKLAELAISPQILPYRECPGAVPQAARLIGGDITAFRHQVIAELRGTSGCTHLNDMLRALSDIVYLNNITMD